MEPFDHVPTHRAVRAERAALRHLGGGCQVPIAAYAFAEGPRLRLFGAVASLDGSNLVRATVVGPPEDPERLGATLAEDLLKQGARAILDSI